VELKVAKESSSSMSSRSAS